MKKTFAILLVTILALLAAGALAAGDDSPRMILVTCYPFYYSGHAPKQFVAVCTIR